MADSKEFLVRHRDLQIQEIVSFWRKYGFWDYPYEELCKIIEQHIQYDTLETVVFKGEIIAISRWNVNGDCVEIFETVVHPNWRNKNLTKLMLINGLKRWAEKYGKTCVKIKYIRSMREKRERIYDVYKFLGTDRIKCEKNDMKV